MYVICKNDFPWAICPEGTTFEEAHAMAQVQQLGELCKEVESRVHMHVQQTELLTPDQVVQLRSGRAI